MWTLNVNVNVESEIERTWSGTLMQMRCNVMGKGKQMPSISIMITGHWIEMHADKTIANIIHAFLRALVSLPSIVEEKPYPAQCWEQTKDSH